MLVLRFDGAEQRRLIRFAIVGASNGAVTLVVYTAAIALGVWYPVAASLGYAAGILNGYTWNRTWTFQTGSFHLPEFSRYVLVSGCGLAANVIGIIFAVEVLGLGELAGEIASLLPIVLVTYVVNRWWTFRPRPESPPA